MEIITSEKVPVKEVFVKSVSDILTCDEHKALLKYWTSSKGHIDLDKPITCCVSECQNKTNIGIIVTKEDISKEKKKNKLCTVVDESDITAKKSFIVPVCEDHLTLMAEGVWIGELWLVDMKK
jgi:hypothetical protein